MPNYFYIDQNGQKQGPINDQHLKTLVAQGVIMPDTPLETDMGHKGWAGQIPSLFPSNPPPIPVAPFARLNAAPPQAPVPPSPPIIPKQVFCTNCGNAISEQAAACMSCGAKPPGHKKFCRQCGVALNPEQVVCIQCGAGLVGTSAIGGALATNVMSAFQTTNVPLDPVQRKDRITFWTMLLTVSYGLLLLAVIGIHLLTAAVPYTAKEVQKKSTILKDRSSSDLGAEGAAIRSILGRDIQLPPITIGPSYEEVKAGIETRTAIISSALIIPTSLAFMCCFYIWLLRLWEEVPQRFARTSPVNAALFALIPYYNWYWNFTVFYGLYGDMNKATQSYGLGYRFDVTLIKSVCIGWIILGVLSNVPVITSLEPWVAVILGGFAVIVVLAQALITLPTYWNLRKNVLEFIDIKASVGEP